MDERIPRDPGDDRTQVFAELYATHYRPLVAFCRRLTSSADPEELAQEAFLRAWSSWDRYAPTRPFWPWVSTIARRLCIDRGRRLRTAQARGPYAVDDRNTTPTPEDLVELEEEYRWARAALEELRPDQRRVLRLRDVEGWSYDRIADHEGVTVESVRGSLRRARSQLRVVYARMSSAAPLIVLVALVRDLRRRLADLSHRVQSNFASAGVVGARAAESVAAIVVLAMGTAAVHVPGTAPSHAFAASSPTGGIVTPTTAGDSTTSPAGGSSSAMRNGGGRDATGVLGGVGGVAGGVVGGPAGGPSLGRQLDNVPVPGRGSNEPEAATFMSFTPSPNYQHDHVVYASGASQRDCAFACPSLFRSTDGGASWHRLPGFGFEGGVVMLPPSYPADSRIFVGGPNALKVSSDDGATFAPLTPAGGYTAMSPAFSAGDGQILVGAIPGWIYHDDNKAVTPFDSVPESASAALSFAYAPTYPRDHRIVVGGTDPSTNQNAIVSACDGSNCTAPAVLAGVTGTPAVMTSRSYSSSGLSFAWSGDKLFRSTDGAASFGQLTLPAAGQVQALAEDARGTLYVALLNNAPGGTNGGLFASRDAGSKWTRLGAGTVLDHGVAAVVALPSGNLLASPFSNGGGGLQCSSDGGRTWGPRCP